MIPPVALDEVVDDQAPLTPPVHAPAGASETDDALALPEIDHALVVLELDQALTVEEDPPVIVLPEVVSVLDPPFHQVWAEEDELGLETSQDEAGWVKEVEEGEEAEEGEDVPLLVVVERLVEDAIELVEGDEEERDPESEPDVDEVQDDEEVGTVDDPKRSVEEAVLDEICDSGDDDVVFGLVSVSFRAPVPLVASDVADLCVITSTPA